MNAEGSRALLNPHLNNKNILKKKKLNPHLILHLSYAVYVGPRSWVSVPEISGLGAQVFVHGIQGAHAAIFL